MRCGLRALRTRPGSLGVTPFGEHPYALFAAFEAETEEEREDALEWSIRCEKKPKSRTAAVRV